MSLSMLMFLLMAAVALLLVAVLVIRSMLRGRLRGMRSRSTDIGGLPPLPEAVGDPVIPPATGRYVGSALGPGRLARIADHDELDEAVLTRYAEGIMVERSGSRPIWIPAESIVAILTEDQTLTIRWRLPSGMQVDTGFRGDDRRKIADWLKESTR